MEDKFDYKEREKYQKTAQKRRREERWDERVLFRLFVLWRGFTMNDVTLASFTSRGEAA